MEAEKYTLYKSCVHVLVFQRKPCLCFMNRFDSLKQVHHLDTNNFNQKKENEKKRENIQFTTFCNTCIRRLLKGN